MSSASAAKPAAVSTRRVRKPPRSLWNGMVVFGEVVVPVSLQVARQREDLAFVLLHRGCGGRIVQPKRCSKHKREVKQSEIVKGFEFATGHYVEVEDDELGGGPAASKAIPLVWFFRPDERLLIHLDSTYYLAPRRGEADVAAYSLLFLALHAEEAAGLGAIVMYGREYPCVVYPLGGVLCLSTLYLAADVRSPREILRALSRASGSDRELLLGRKLIAETCMPFEPKRLRSHHRARVRALVRQKVRAGKGIVQSPGGAPLDLEKALRESLAHERGRKGR